MSSQIANLILLIAGSSAACIAAIVGALCLRRMQSTAGALTLQNAPQMLRAETDIVRSVIEQHARGQRQEMGQSLADFQQLTLAAFGTIRDGINAQVHGFGDRLDQSSKSVDDKVTAISSKLNDDMVQMRSEAVAGRDSLRTTIEDKLTQSITSHADASKQLRDELGGNFQRLGTRVSESLAEASAFQTERLQNVTSSVADLAEKLAQAQERLRLSVEGRLDAIRQESATKLEEMRITVDDKLQKTLETRLGESFNRVVEQLERVHKGIGEMQTLAANVGDLKNVLTNVKVRGTYGEAQLELLLEQFLSPEQFIKNASVNSGSAERVEFAVKFPGNGEQVLLPIDSKFPREDYDHLQEAITAGDTKGITHFRRELENKIKFCAREISTKYINPPYTLEFAILFIPTESLYAELMRQPGLVEQLQRDHRVMLAGPTNLAALLTSFQMGFRALALQKRSGEVWQLLGAIKKEFENYGDVVDKLGRQLTTASNSVESLGKRARVMSRKLKAVEMLPDQTTAEKLLGLDGDCAEIVDEIVTPVASEIVVPAK